MLPIVGNLLFTLRQKFLDFVLHVSNLQIKIFGLVQKFDIL